MKMKRFLVFLLVAVLGVGSLMGCSSDESVETEVDQVENEEVEVDPEEDVELLVSAAASLTDVLEEIKEAYSEVSPETSLTFTLGSSGALQAQIEEGAPVDVFMSAAQKQMDALEEGGLIEEDTRKTLLINKVVLIAPKDSELDIESFEDMTKDEVDKIGVGDPSNVPVGQYSQEIFENLNLKDKLDKDEKLVLGNDVRTVLTWVETGEVDLGLVYETDALTSDKIEIISEAPQGSHKEVSYPVASVKASENKEAAQDFLDFLSSDKAKELFEKYGFTIK